jgi:hypothetical protein
MATARQKQTAKQNIKKAQSSSPGSRGRSSQSDGMSTAKRNDLPKDKFAFPKERKEPINDAAHVRNAVARFDQVEGVTDAERDAAWKRIRAAARKFGVEIEVRGWRSLMKGGKAASGKK